MPVLDLLTVKREASKARLAQEVVNVREWNTHMKAYLEELLNPSMNVYCSRQKNSIKQFSFKEADISTLASMAPTKFGLFKARSRDQQDQPSTENLLKSSDSIDQGAPSSPIPSTSRGIVEDISPHDFSVLNIDDDEDYDDDEDVPVKPISRRNSQHSICENPLGNYQQLQNSSLTSTSTLDLDQIDIYDEPETCVEGNSTACDANSSQFDVTSLQFDEDFETTSITADDWSLYCSIMKKPKRKGKEQQLSDVDMWRASNVEVMQNLLHRSGTLDEQIKWEAIATARGLCTLTDSCTCADCSGAKYLVGVTDGDGGLGSAPLFSAIGVGCQIQ